MIASSAQVAVPVRHTFTRTFVVVLVCILVGVICSLLYGPVVRKFLDNSSDHSIHVGFAEFLYKTHRLPTPHFLYQGLVALLVWLMPLVSFKTAGLIVVTASYASTGALLCWKATKDLIPIAGSRRILLRGAVLSIFFATAVMIMQPIVGSGETQMYRIGYIWAEPYYSPTCALMKAFALASALFAAHLLGAQSRGTLSGWLIAACAVATAAGTLAKPSFAICLVPATLAFVGMRVLRHKSVDWRAIALGLVMPAGLVLALQYHLSFSGAAGATAYQNSIVFAPLKVMSYHSKDLLRKFLFSVAFPLLVYTLYWARARRDVGLNFGMLVLGFGAAYGYLISEKVNGWTGNFLWSSYIGLFIAYVFAAFFYLRQILNGLHNRVELTRHILCLLLFLLHVRSGILTEAAFLSTQLGGYR